MVNVICMKWGTVYGPEYVNRLYNGVRRHLTDIDYRFVCLTDDKEGISSDVECLPLPEFLPPPGKPNSAFRKLSVFSDPLYDLTGTALFFDLDVLIVDSIDCFFEHPGRFCVIHNWIEPRKRLFRPRPYIGNSSVFRFEIGQERQILDRYNSDVLKADRLYPTEQAFMSYWASQLTWWPEEWCRSFKRHCIPFPPLNLIQRPKMPKDSRVIVFHGRPNPDDFNEGRYENGWRKTALEPSWLAANWQ